MIQATHTPVSFEQLLEIVDRLDTSKRAMLHKQLVRREEESLVRQAERAAREFNLPGLQARLSYWSVEKVLAGLNHRLGVNEQKFGADSKTFYVLSRKGQKATSAEEVEWAYLYETYQRLQTARRRVDIKMGRTIKPLSVGEVVSKQLTLIEVEEKLRRFEQQHGIPSPKFYKRFKQGKQGDSLETFAWVHTYVAYLAMSDTDHARTSQDV